MRPLSQVETRGRSILPWTLYPLFSFCVYAVMCFMPLLGICFVESKQIEQTVFYDSKLPAFICLTVCVIFKLPAKIKKV